MTYFTHQSSGPLRRQSAFTFVLFILAWAVLNGIGPATAQDRMPVVVELFTSQGCSSCPAADRLLGDLVDRADVIALTEAVDYWDYLGWKDENGRPEHSARQRGYALQRGDRRVYTPQMVVNGRSHLVGSDRAAVDRAIKRFSRGAGSLSVPITIRTEGDIVHIGIDKAEANGASLRDGTLYLMPFVKRTDVVIKRGENRGNTISYYNVVRDIRPIGMWHGQSVAIELPKKEICKGGIDGFAILLQADIGGRPGPIFGASLYNVP